MMLKQEIRNRKLPDLFYFQDGSPVTLSTWNARRKELISLFCAETYGILPPAPLAWNATLETSEENFCAGKATLSKVLLTVQLEQGTFSFPAYTVIPKTDAPCPAFLHINFRDNIPDRYMPSEEICDNGFAVVSFCYQDVTSDDQDFSSGLAGLLHLAENRTPSSPGKIALWAWAAMRVMDYIQTLQMVDFQHIAVVGHSRLGKTALLTGALDDRFFLTISNDSGCDGAALSRCKSGETVQDICRSFPYWFCPNHLVYAKNESALPFDQHALLALIAPRLAYVGSAVEDSWADPISEYLSCVAASPAYQLLGVPGFCHPDRYPKPGDSFHQGYIAYHLRHGCHYFSRIDWQQYMQFFHDRIAPAT